MNFLKLMVAMLSTFGLINVHAQEGIHASGGDVTGPGGSVSYSVGQPFYQWSSSTSNSVAEGVQQPYEISMVTGMEDEVAINLSFSIYPNPTADQIILTASGEDIGSLSYQLRDINGKLIDSKNIYANSTSISMAKLNSATYFLKVIKRDKDVGTFKIIKN